MCQGQLLMGRWLLALYAVALLAYRFRALTITSCLLPLQTRARETSLSTGTMRIARCPWEGYGRTMCSTLPLVSIFRHRQPHGRGPTVGPPVIFSTNESPLPKFVSYYVDKHVRMRNSGCKSLIAKTNVVVK